MSARFGTSAQERLLVEYVDTILADVFQGRRPELREHLIGVAAKVSRKHPWPYFDECVSTEVERRLAGKEPIDGSRYVCGLAGPSSEARS